MNKRVIELQELIDKANLAYYNDGDSIMEDARYDKIKSELQTRNPSDARLTQVGASISNRDSILQKKAHTIPMGSQNKALNETEFREWFKNNIAKKLTSSNPIFHASYKMDGGSCSLEYKNGVLVAALTRGDGNVGLDITANASKFKNIPTRCAIGGKPFSGFVRGEVILTTDDWKLIDPDSQSNPRNLGTGITGRKDGTQSDLLKFFAFRVFDVDGEEFGDTETELSQFMEKMGFEIAPFIKGDLETVWNWYLNIQTIRPALPFWIDGIVIKLDDLEKQLSLGVASGCPCGQVAIKFEASGEVTTLRNVSIQVGSTGAIVPVANFDSVKIGGTNITNATLCNWDNIKTLGLCIGDDIFVIKAGDIIPRVMEVVKQGAKRIPITQPTHCPVCNSKTEHKSNIDGNNSTAIYCSNSDCPSVVTGKIDKYLTSLDILGVGTNLIQSLVTDIGVKTVADMYKLSSKRDAIADIVLSGKVRLGEKRADKFLEEIEKKRNLTISDFLGSLGIHGLGKRRVSLIQDALEGEMDTLDKWFDGTLVYNAQKAGVPNIASRIHDELLKQKSLIMECIANGVVITKPKPKQAIKEGAYVICITGALSQPKSFYEELIEKKEHVYTDTFSKSVTYLVAADINSGSSKLKKAEKQGTKILDEAGLIKLLNG